MTIYHIVLVKYTASATLAQKHAWKESVTALASTIPQIKELISGSKLSHVRDGGWDDGVIMTFDNEDDLKTYADAAPHKEYQQVTAEQTADKLIFDIKT